MSKIGLKVTKISSGVQEIMTINGGDWTRKVVDIRTDIKVLSGTALEEGEDVIMLSFIPTGSLITLFHTITGRSGDLISAWIYFPGDSAITAEEELEAIERVKIEISKSKVDDWNVLQDFLSKDYPKKLSFQYKESEPNGPCAVRYFGQGTDYVLKELLGAKLYQTEYTEHKYVFLLDTNSKIAVNEKLANYTNTPLKEWIVVAPPQLPAGVTAKLNGTVFNNCVVAYRGQTISVILERPGFVAQNCMITACPQPVISLDSMVWQKHFRLASFLVTDEDRNPINNVRIQLNGMTIDRNGLNMKESDCQQVRLSVSSPDCEDYSGTVNLLSGSEPFRFTLKRTKSQEIYCISQQECPNLKQCPPLYEVVREVRRGKTTYKYCEPVSQTAGGKWKKIAIIAAVIALLVGLFCGALGYKYYVSSKPQEPKPNVSTNTQPDNKSDQDNTNSKTDEKLSNPVPPKVYSCLNGTTWFKDSLEKEEDLKGLYEDLYKGRIKNILDVWGREIDPEANPEWGDVIVGIKKQHERGKGKVDFRNFRLGSNNNQAFDTDSYLNWLTRYVDDKMPKETKNRSNDNPKKDMDAY